MAKRTDEQELRSFVACAEEALSRALAAFAEAKVKGSKALTKEVWERLDEAEGYCSNAAKHCLEVIYEVEDAEAEERQAREPFDHDGLEMRE